jgi:hypothetical protein
LLGDSCSYSPSAACSCLLCFAILAATTQLKLPLQLPSSKNKLPAGKLLTNERKNFAAATTAVGFEVDGERTQWRFWIWPQRWRRWAEERDQRGGGTGSPAAAMVTGANLTLSLF